VSRAWLAVALSIGCTPTSRSGEARRHADLPPPALPDVPAGPFFLANPLAKVVPVLRPDAPNLRYANLDRDACEAELTRREVPFIVGEPTAGVDAPVRLRGPLHGVELHPEQARKHSSYDVLDCRLVLALDDFAALVAASHVTQIIYAYAYRPKTESGCTRKYWGLQHCAALAIDVHAFKHEDGTVLDVQHDFHGHLGLPTCVDGVGPSHATPAATELWSFACGAAERALFNVVLTPNWNSEHHNHFHLELTPGAWWMMVH
jgi:hypothetical protein